MNIFNRAIHSYCKNQYYTGDFFFFCYDFVDQMPKYHLYLKLGSTASAIYHFTFSLFHILQLFCLLLAGQKHGKWKS